MTEDEIRAIVRDEINKTVEPFIEPLIDVIVGASDVFTGILDPSKLVGSIINLGQISDGSDT